VTAPGHHLLRHADTVPAPAWAHASVGLRRAELVNGEHGSVHMGLGLVELSDGHVDLHVHSHEEGFYVLAGEPILHLDGRSMRLRPGACGAIPVGMPHAWRADAPARWIDMRAPRPRRDPPDTFLLGPAPAEEPAPLDIRDPRSRHFFRMVDSDIQVDKLKIGARANAPTVSASMATALLAYSGIAVKMLVDQRLDSALLTMFMVEYQPGGVAHPHDHPFEETYYILEGEVEAVADDKRYVLRPGDLFWTGVGSVHAFYNTAGGTVRWLETQSPQPPVRHSYRFVRDWEYLKEKLAAAGPSNRKAAAAQ